MQGCARRGAAYRAGSGARPSFRGSAARFRSRTAEAGAGVQPVLMGFALPDDRLHGPNEKLHLPTFFRGIEARWRCAIAGSAPAWRREAAA